MMQYDEDPFTYIVSFMKALVCTLILFIFMLTVTYWIL